MRCQNSPDNNRRCKRTASKIAIVKDGIEKQSRFWICDDCFNEKLFSDQLFKDDLVNLTNYNSEITFYYNLRLLTNKKICLEMI